jgi:hypothetical protein
MPAAGYTRIMLKVLLFDVAAIPFLTPPIAKNIAMPMSILGRRQASDQKVAEPVKGEALLEPFQNFSRSLGLGNLRSGAAEFEDWSFVIDLYRRPPNVWTAEERDPSVESGNLNITKA